MDEVTTYLSRAQFDEALSLLGWTFDDLERAARVPKATISRTRAADGRGNARRQQTVLKLRRAFEAAGVRFTAEGPLLGGPPP